MNLNYKQFENFFKNCLHVKESIIFINQKFKKNLDPINLLIKNLLETLKVLKIKYCNFEEEEIFNLFS